MHEEFVLGIDGGGTKTLAVIARSGGEVVGYGLGGSANIDDVGIPAVQENLRSAVAAACQQAGLPAKPFASVFLGVAGIVSQQDRAEIRQMALNLNLAMPEQIGVDHDCRIALAGGLSGRPGIVLITGTGSSCYGRTADGQDWRSGGWGYLLSDEGSSYWLGLQAMKSAVMIYDGRLPSSLLLENVKGALGLVDMNNMMQRLYVQKMARSEIAALGRLVIQAAQSGDRLSEQLIQQGTDDLAACVLAVANRLGFAGTHSGTLCEVVLVGGLLKAGEVFLAPLKQAILDCLPHSQIQLAELPPVAGACLLALQSLGIRVDEKLAQVMSQTAQFPD